MKKGIYTNKQNFNVRLIKPAEEETWDNLMKKYHYLGFERLSGETLKYVAKLDGKWVAILGWGSAAFKCKERDQTRD